MSETLLHAPPGRAEPLDVERCIAEWATLTAEDRLVVFDALGDAEAADLFLRLDSAAQAEHLLAVPAPARKLWARLLAPDDAADVIQQVSDAERSALLDALEPTARAQVQGLLAYADDDAGGLMDPRYVALRAEMTADQALTYLRAYAREHASTVYYVYVLDHEHRPVGVLSWREILRARPHDPIDRVMQRDMITVRADADQEEVARLIAKHDLLAIPVVDGEGRMKGVVTVDDVVDVVNEEATEDIQKMGAVEALDEPYLTISFFEMIKKRAGWLTILFVGEMLTATAMGWFADEINKAVVLALFLPLIISSGGNSGSQASTLVVRALATGDVRIADWWRVARRELASGLALGAILAPIGFLRIIFWPGRDALYGPHAVRIAATVGLSLVGVVLWGTMSGSMLPIFLRKLGFDPASASAPFVATLVDVTGLVIYFSVASVVLDGVML